MYLAGRLKATQMLAGVRIRSVAAVAEALSTTPDERKTEEIVIPNRIQRSPTDILYALAATVGRDPTAPHYKYHDDPYLIPRSGADKRLFALTQESGRKEAKWIREEHRELFMHQEAQPPIELFSPDAVYDENSEVSVELLQKLITKRQLKSAVSVYNLLKQKKIAVDDTVKQSLLEFVAFYNNVEPDKLENIEERWFLQDQARDAGVRKTWKDGGLAEELFREIEPKTAASYAAIIRGMAKFHNCERAYALFQEAEENGFQLDTETYNHILEIVHLLRESAEEQWALCTDLLKQMAAKQIRPNLGTLNGALHCISGFGHYSFACSSAQKLLAEFKQLGIEPSLATYYYMLLVFCRQHSPRNNVLEGIINELEGKEFTIRHARDTHFFVTAMNVCRYSARDNALAKRLDALLHTGKNYELIGSTYVENMYYRHYLTLLCQTEPLDEFMKTYNLLVPNIATPDMGPMFEILNAIDLNGAIELVPRIWSDLVVFDYVREKFVQKVLHIMATNKPNPELPSHQELPKQLGNVALNIFEKLTDADVRPHRKIMATGEMYGNILVSLTRAQDFQNAQKVFEYIRAEHNSIAGSPTEDSLIEFVNECIRNKSPSMSIKVAQYAADMSMDTRWFARVIQEGFTLNQQQLNELNDLAGVQNQN